MLRKLVGCCLLVALTSCSRDVKPPGRAIDYYFIEGSNTDAVISSYRFVTGNAVLLPRWADGFWQSRERYNTQPEVPGTVAEYRKRPIPLDNIVQDWGR